MDVKFNPTVHQVTEQNDPLRSVDGSVKLRTNWKDLAVDRQGRKYNARVHGDKHELDEDGYLKVRRREAKPDLLNTGRSQSFVSKYHEHGYAYRLINDDGGRVEQFMENDWEVVLDSKTGEAAKMAVGQARSPNTTALLVRKPIEWYNEDQLKKREHNKTELKQKTAPSAADGQYEATPSSPLR